MRIMLARVSPKIVVVLSVAIFLLCLEHQESRQQKHGMMNRPMIAQLAPQHEEGSVVDARQIHAFAALFNLCPTGEIQSIELNVSAAGCKPTLKVMILQGDGSIVTVYAIVEGLRVANMQNGIIVLKKGDLQADGETL